MSQKTREINRNMKLRYGAFAALLAVVLLVLIVAVFSATHKKQPVAVSNNAVVSQYRDKLPKLKAAAESKSATAAAHTAYAQALYVTGDKQTAQKEYESATKQDPKNASVWNNLGNVYRDLKNYAAADEAYRKAFEIDPSFVNAYVNLATMQAYTLNKPADAVATYKQAVTKNGQSTELLLLLGAAYEQNHQTSLALSTYRTVLEKDPKNIAAKQNVDRLAKQ